MKHTYIAIAATLGLSALAPLQAELLDLVPLPPVITFNLDGTTNYNAATDIFTLDATPLSMIETTGSSRFDENISRSFEINILVDENGVVSSNTDPTIPDFLLFGSVNGFTGDSNNPLLTGTISEFGFLNNGANDEFDFRFSVTGGQLSSIYEDEFKDLYVKYTSEGSTFEGFNNNFDGGAKGNIFATMEAAPVPEPSTYALIAGLIVLGFSFVRRQLNK